MALAKGIDDFIGYVKAATNFEDIEIYLQEAETRFLKPMISAAQYNALHAAYQAAASDDALSPADRELITRCRPVIVNYALAIGVPKLQVVVSSSGVHIYSNEQQKTAFSWQIDDLVNGYFASGDSYADALLQYMEENKATYTAWANSSAYTVFKSVLVPDTATFSSIVNINDSRRVFLRLKPAMLVIQDMKIKSAISSAYFAELLAEISSGTFTPANEEPLLLAQKAMVYLSCSHALAEMTINVGVDGVSITASRNTDKTQTKAPAELNRISAIASSWQDTGNSYLAELVAYLNQNASASLYATYFNSTQYRNPATDDGLFTNDETWGIVMI